MGRHSRPGRSRGVPAATAKAALAVLTVAAVTGMTWGHHGDRATETAPAAARDEPALRPTDAADLPAGSARSTRPTRRAADRPSRARPRPPALPGCPAKVDTDHPNGALPTHAICALPGTDHALRADAALAFAELNAAFRNRFGRPLCLTDSYRSLSAQQQLYATKPGLAAPPGTSNHGWGTAVDVCGGAEAEGSAAHSWLSERGAAFGWVNPGWARSGGNRPEPWHWEFVPGR